MRIARSTAVFATLLVVATACSDGPGNTDDASDTIARASTTTAVATSTTGDPRPEGPVADLSEEITGGDGVFIGSANPGELGDGYLEQEFVAAGEATSYSVVGELTADGRWTLDPDVAASYRTRVLVRRPATAEDFSGTVLVEWLNVSGGVDADPDFATLREEIMRSGHAWVGVSAQVIGVEGGPVAVAVDVPGSDAAGKGLVAIDPQRYGTLEHPGDAFAYDIFTQVARAVRAGGPAFRGLQPEQVVAVGESQSAFALVSYINGVQPLTETFDGFFVHSRGGAGLAFPEPGAAADIAGSIGGVATILRTDTSVPILEIQTESDVSGILNSAAARQDDTDTFRLWEVTGTAHADRHLLGDTADLMECGVEINDGPLHVVAKAGLRHLVGWVEGGAPPPSAPLIELDDAGAVVRDADGIAIGGLRTPPVDVPARALSGAAGTDPSVICLLLGSTNPIAPERLSELHGTRNNFEEAYAAAVDAAIEAGFVLEDDRAALEAFAHAELVPPSS